MDFTHICLKKGSALSAKCFTVIRRIFREDASPKPGASQKSSEFVGPRALYPLHRLTSDPITPGSLPAFEGLDHSPFLRGPVVSGSHGAAFPAPDASTGCWIQAVGAWLRGHVILRCHRGPRTRTVRRSVFFREMIPPLPASPLPAKSAT